MEQDPASRPHTPLAALAGASLVDSLFDMPERRVSDDERLRRAQLESRLAAEMRGMIDARLRDGTS